MEAEAAVTCSLDSKQASQGRQAAQEKALVAALAAAPGNLAPPISSSPPS